MDVNTSRKRKRSTNNTDFNFSNKCAASAVDEAPELPGFYYDKDRKRYFKILPSHAAVSSAITCDVIKQKKQEKHWNQDKKNANSSKSALPSSRSLPLLLQHVQTGILKESRLRDLYFCGRLSSLRPCHRQKENLLRNRDSSDIKYIQEIHIDPSERGLLCLGNMKNIKSSKIQYFPIQVTEPKRKKPKVILDHDCNAYANQPVVSAITSVCLIPPTNEVCGGVQVLYTSLLQTSSWESRSYAKVDTGDRRVTFRCDLGPSYVWTSAWSPLGDCFSVGLENHAVVVDINRSHKTVTELRTCSDPMTQVFTSPTNLLSGTRAGTIVAHDLRSLSTYPVYTLKQTSSICSLQSLKDNTKLISSDANGKVCLWDMRVQKQIIQYEGLVNQGKQQIPIHVDSSEKFVYGVGQDSYVRFWALTSGQQLLTLPPPEKPDPSYLPSVAFSNSWRDNPMCAGLFYSQNEALYFYSTLVF